MAFQKTSSDFCVSLSNSEFTNKQIETHKIWWNPDTRPEWFNFQHKGLVFHKTLPIDIDALRKAQSTDTNFQEYRKDGNRKKNLIYNDLKKNGYDLRCKGMHIVINDEGKVIAVFGGNTVHTGLRKFSSLQNRICYVFKTTDDFNKNNLISVGTYLNSLEKDFGANNEDDAISSINQMLENGAYPLDTNASESQIVNWIEDVENEAKWMMNADVELKKVQSFLHSYIEGVTTKKRVIDVTLGSEVLPLAATNGYRPNNTIEYVSMSCMPKASLWIIKNKIKDILIDNPAFFRRGGRLQVINHLGTPDTKDPVEDFFKSYTDYWNDMKSYMECVNPEWKFFYTDDKEKQRLAPVDFLGGFQQVEGLEETWELQTVVPFDEIKEEWYDRNKSLVA